MRTGWLSEYTNWTFVTWRLYTSPHWPKTADVQWVFLTRAFTWRNQVLETVYRRKKETKHLELKRLTSKWYKEWVVIIITVSVISHNIASLWIVPVTFMTNSRTLPSCLPHEWKKPKTWDVFRNLLSNSQVFAVHRFWVIFVYQVLLGNKF